MYCMIMAKMVDNAFVFKRKTLKKNNVIITERILYFNNLEFSKFWN